MKTIKLVLISVISISILVYIFNPFLFTPFQWKDTLQITEVSVLLSDNEKIIISNEEQIKDIHLLISEMDVVPLIEGTDHIDSPTKELPFIRLLFKESNKHYIFHSGGNSSYYLEYERVSSHFSNIVANGEEIHEKLLGVLLNEK